MSKPPKASMAKNPDRDSQEPKTPDIAVHEDKKPTNLRANAVPINGYVLSVDGKFKSHYDNSADALAAGFRLKQTYPVIQVAIYDAAGRSYTSVEVHDLEKAAAPPQSADSV